MRTQRGVPFSAVLALVAVFWLSTFVILHNASFMDGPRDEADRALAIVARDTGFSLILLAASFVLRRRPNGDSTG